MEERDATFFTLLSAPIVDEADIASCKRWCKLIAERLGFRTVSWTRVATAVSEITRNALQYGGGGNITFSLSLERRKPEFRIIVDDDGPGIENPEDVYAEGFRSVNGMGVGIAGSRRLVNDFEIVSRQGGGTRVAMSIALDELENPITLRDAASIREELISGGGIDPLAELRRQNRELVRSLETNAKQREELARANRRLEEQADAQKKLSEKLNTVLDNLPDSVFMIESDGSVVYANSPAQTLSEGKKDYIPFDLDDLVHKSIMTGVNYHPTGQDGMIQVKMNRDDRFFLPQVTCFKTLGSKLSNVLLSLRDVTDFKLLDDVKTDLLGTVSHEIKGPVTSIRMAVLLLLDDCIGKLNSEQKELVDTAKEEIERLLRTLNNLLDVGRFSNGAYQLDRSEIEVTVLLKRAIDEMTRLARHKKITLRRVESDQTVPFVNVDQERMTYVLNNFVSNAIKHSPEGSEVRIGFELTKSDEVRLYVEDDGPGIPRQYQGIIFNRYAKVPGNKKPGSGLGLSIAREFVQAHGGAVGVTSEVGVGSKFFCTLSVAG